MGSAGVRHQETARGRLEEGERLLRERRHRVGLRELETLHRELCAEQTPRIQLLGDTANSLGNALFGLGRVDRAARVFDDSVRRLGSGMQRMGAGADQHRSLALISLTLVTSLVGLARIRRRQGRAGEARQLMEVAIGTVLSRGVALWEREPPANETLSTQLAQLASELLRQQLHPQAERVLRMEVKERERMGDSARQISRARIHLGLSLMSQGRFDEAAKMFRKALLDRARANAPVDAVCNARCWLATGLLALGDSEEAELVLLDGLREVRKLESQTGVRSALRYTLARVNLAQGRMDSAEHMLRRALADLELDAGATPISPPLREELIRTLRSSDDEAEHRLLKALQRAQRPGLHPAALQQLRREVRREPRDSLVGLSSTTTLQAFDAINLEPHEEGG